jgi:hypothetical protein
MNRDQLIVAFMNRAERAADEVLRLREALRLAGNTSLAAREIAEAALAIWPKVDSFQKSVRR